MRIRKTNAIIGVSLAVGALFMIYLVLDTLGSGYEDPELLQVSFLLRPFRAFILTNLDSLLQV